MSGDINPVQSQRPMDGGTGMHLLPRQLSPLGLVPLFTRGWHVEEWEVGRDRVQELTKAKYYIGGR